LLKWLFGNSDIVDKASKAIDASVLTDEEKMQYFIEYQKATLPQNVARRLLALMVVGLYLVFIMLCAALYKIDLEYAQFIYDLAKETLLTPVTVIIGFYFMKRFSMGK
jgi:cation transport ATPase